MQAIDFLMTYINNFEKSFKFLSQDVDKLEKPAIIGGSQRRNAFGFNVEAAESTTSTSVRRP